MTETQTDSDSAELLREGMVAELRKQGAIVSDEVEAAFRAVPRHCFAPEVPAEDVYGAPEGVVTKRTTEGRWVSSVSAPWLHARMLEAARVAPGMRVLEIGSGGCNAALLSELVGPEGEVTSIDIDPDITARAQRLLAATGYDRVQVITADGAQPTSDATGGGFDRIIVTVGAADLPAPWVDQLADDGRLLVPLRFRSLSRTIAFTREDDHLRSDALIRSGFVAMQGVSAHAPRTVQLAGSDVRLVVDEDQAVDDTALTKAFAEPRCERWTGVELTGSERVLPRLDVWLAGAVAPYGRLRATSEANDRGLVGWVLGSGAACIWTGDSLAYLTLRAQEGHRDGFEIGVIGHGPAREELSERLATAVSRFDREARHAGEPVVRAYIRGRRGFPAGDAVTVDKPSAGLVIGT